MKKKALEINFGKTIIIVLILIVVGAIYLFSNGIGKVSVKSITKTCQNACDNADEEAWCAVERNVRFKDQRDERDRGYTCDTLATMEDISLLCSIDCNSGVDFNPENCLEMGDEYELVGIDEQGELKCPEETSSVISVDTTPRAGETKTRLCCKGTILPNPPEE